MKTFSRLSLLLCMAVLVAACQPSYKSVPNDPLNARIYTLDNGMKVYMTVNKDEPRIQTYIAVRVGGKNDPAETTGLAHYFEHLMFKGTRQFGTMNYEMEKPLLDQIEALFEVYRTKTDEAERQAIYHQIDSISYEASRYFIPNEYDKLMSAIGASGTNAYTGFDMTVYTEDIPSNQIENWAKIQSDRFQNAVIRGFHTELETVYEEKNMSLTNDARKVYEKVLSTLFPHHPYGTQTVLGTQENLKNPSIINIKNYFNTYYVPNNIAICLSGDFNPEEMIRIIKKYFSSMQPNDSLPKLQFESEQPLEAPVISEVFGNNAENITLAWRFPGKSSPDFNLLSLTDMIMCNGKAGLIDLNLLQQQKVLSAWSGIYDMADYSAFMLQGKPKQGQTLDEVKALMMEQVEKLKAGDFDDFLLEATINNFKLQQLQDLRHNSNRADMFVDAFINSVDWADEVARIERMSHITKEDIVNFANKWLTDGYAVVYKRQGTDPNEKKIAKPQITPIMTNRDTASAFLKEIQASQVRPIEPVFLDYDKDLTRFNTDSKLPVLYVQNTSDDLFNLHFRFEMGIYSNKMLNTAFTYLDYLGTSDYTSEQIKSEFYKMACSFNISASSETSTISLSGLGENMPEALALLEKLLSDPQANQEAFDNMIKDIRKARVDAKLNQSQVFNRLLNYTIFGPHSPQIETILSDKELKQLKPETLIGIIKSMTSYQHRVLYFGPETPEELLNILADYHVVPAALKDVSKAREFPYQETKENKVFFAHYNAKQLYMSSFSNTGELFDAEREPIRSMYNEYFSGGMNAIVFQEMREARGLAYSAFAGYEEPNKAGKPYDMYTFIATQTDKMKDALEAFDQIINEMPESEAAFQLAKDGMEARLRTERINDFSIIANYLQAEKYQQTTDSRKLLFEELPSMTLQDVKAFQEKWIKGRCYYQCLIGDEKDVDFKALSAYGPVSKLSLETIFGY